MTNQSLVYTGFACQKCGHYPLEQDLEEIEKEGDHEGAAILFCPSCKQQYLVVFKIVPCRIVETEGEMPDATVLDKLKERAVYN